MAAEIQTPMGTALPPAPRHAITVHLPTWRSIERFNDRDPSLFAQLKSMYPRFVLHRDVLELTQKIIEFADLDSQAWGCYIFPSPQVATMCIDFATAAARGEGTISRDRISTRTFRIRGDPLLIVLYAVIFPVERTSTVHSFWLNAGVGISSRLAEDCLTNIDSLTEGQQESKPDGEKSSLSTVTAWTTPAHTTLQERISMMLNRAPAAGAARGPRTTTSTSTGTVTEVSVSVSVSASDVYLFPTGMAAIYWTHRIVLSQFDGPSALFGFSFHSTVHVLRDFGPGVEFFGLGDESDLLKLEKYLASRHEQSAANPNANGSSQVQAIWAEFPTNPLLRVADLRRLRDLATRYSALLIVDDTIGSFANVDVLAVADIVVTSLTKSFSGFADVMAGSAVLSPLSRHYTALKTLFDTTYRADPGMGLYVRDAAQLALNSKTYLSRTSILNANAEAVVNFLAMKAEDPLSSVKAVFYPTTSEETVQNYTPFLRVPTPEFPRPGYGCLFSVEFRDLPSVIAFYDNLHVHMGPHLGAHRTIALPYTLGVYGGELEWAGGFNLRVTQVRVSVGLEDKEELVQTFRLAVDAADREFSWRKKDYPVSQN
ncbi:cystathionine gamma-synthase [Cladophialophora carrionii]|uniref:Cystathionine gamma-synthase n=1 Tax=Cladophialophora carrionii TaxID=86049 RepID=A0A1C1CYD3_9EURO|nr:cystathionine gamma-synthase [Cladophialophora carrionii]